MSKRKLITSWSSAENLKSVLNVTLTTVIFNICCIICCEWLICYFLSSVLMYHRFMNLHAGLCGWEASVCVRNVCTARTASCQYRYVRINSSVRRICRNVLGCVSRDLKVLDKTKWSWQARVTRQRCEDLSKPEEREKTSTDVSSLSKAPIDYVSVSPNKTVNVCRYQATWGNYYSSFLADWKQSWDWGRRPVCWKWRRVFAQCEGFRFQRVWSN